jgi:hypothetical protein
MQYNDDDSLSGGSESDASSDAGSVIQEDIYYRVHDNMSTNTFVRGSLASPLSTIRDTCRCNNLESFGNAFTKHDRPVYNLVFLVLLTVFIRVVLDRFH